MTIFDAATLQTSAATIAEGVAQDIADASPDAFEPLPENPTDEQRMRRQAALVLGELLTSASLLAMGLSEKKERNSGALIRLGLGRISSSAMLRHVLECAGHVVTDHADGP